VDKIPVSEVAQNVCKKKLSTDKAFAYFTNNTVLFTFMCSNAMMVHNRTIHRL